MKWTLEDIATAEALLKAKAPASEYERLLGRPKPTCYTKVERVRAARRIAEARVLLSCSAPGPRVVAPTKLFEDAIRRLRAPRSITAWICGDPPPGYSALERRA